MRDRIKQEADVNGRSMNAEIVNALETFYPDTDSFDAILERIEDLKTDLPDDPSPYTREQISAVLDDLAKAIKAETEKRNLPIGLGPSPNDDLLKRQPGIGLGRKPDERLKDQPGLSRSEKSQD